MTNSVILQLTKFGKAGTILPVSSCREASLLPIDSGTDRFFAQSQRRRKDPMKRAYRICLFQCLATTFLLSQSNPAPLLNQSVKVVPVGTSQADPKAQARILDRYGELPLSFEANHGQADGQVKFLSHTSGYTLFLTGDEAVLALSGKRAKDAAPKGASGFGGATVSLKRYLDTNPKPATPQSTTRGVLRMRLRNANAEAKITGTDELAGTSNYFIGNDPTKWRTNVPTYAKVKYEGIYSGIDLVYYGNQRQLEYDFIVAPGAEPHRIAFDVRGAKRIRRDAHGDLVFKLGEDEIRWHKPVVYQEKYGARQLVAARYAITDMNRVGFEVAKYDRSRPLYIDPLIYSTYLGGSGYDYGNSIAVDSAGNAYVTGSTESTDFPVTPGAFQTVCDNGGSRCELNPDAFVTKINAAGSALVYSTYLGGTGYDSGSGIAVDSGGNAYIAGLTQSTDFPITPGAFQTSCNPNFCGDAFVTKINPTGSALVYSTYLGGSKGAGGAGVAVDSAGNAYVVGSTFSSDFPTKNPLQPNYAGGGLYWGDAFVSKFDPTGSALVYSTYLGGSAGDGAFSVAVDSEGNAYITGVTTSTDFPTKNALQPNYGGGGDYYGDAFVTKINAGGSALVYSTYLGGSGGELSAGIAVDSSGNAYVTGITASTDFPTKNALQPANAGKTDVFVTKFNSTGSALIYSTYLGSKDSDVGYGIAADSAGNAYVIGAAGRNFPVTTGALRTIGPAAFVTKFNRTGSGLVYSTYFGGNPTYGIAVDSAGNAYLTGTTSGPGFPLMNPLQPTIGGAEDAFVTKMYIATATTTALSSSPNPSIYGQAVTFTAVVTSALGPPPNGETVSFVEDKNVLGTATLSGGSASFTTSTRPAGTHPIKAVYGGDASFIGSTSKVVNQVVSKATTTTILASSRNPSNFGQSVTFTASVTPQFSGTVKGTVTFYDGAAALKTMALSGGVAKFTTSTLTAGAHSITATYNGNANFDSSSASLTQTVN
jgi:Bacterial Ig-like domain (group 3)/Beta-propeller repeat